ncbi:hypothetical protein V1278_006633 [Bradyrhizobium sp. AZCC 1577]
MAHVEGSGTAALIVRLSKAIFALPDGAKVTHFGSAYSQSQIAAAAEPAPAAASLV